MKNATIIIEPGCFDEVPIPELARFLQNHKLELVCKPDGLKIRRMKQTEKVYVVRGNFMGLSSEETDR